MPVACLDPIVRNTCADILPSRVCTFKGKRVAHVETMPSPQSCVAAVLQRIYAGMCEHMCQRGETRSACASVFRNLLQLTFFIVHNNTHDISHQSDRESFALLSIVVSFNNYANVSYEYIRGLGARTLFVSTSSKLCARMQITAASAIMLGVCVFVCVVVLRGESDPSPLIRLDAHKHMRVVQRSHIAHKSALACDR